LMDWTLLLSAFVGAAAPEIVRLYRLRMKPLPPMPRSYALISVMFFFLAAFVAWVLQATTPYAAFYIGASTDALISSIVGKPPAVLPPKPPDVEKEMKGLIFMGEALPHLTVREYLGVLSGSYEPSKKP
jgi:hypothetical protein